MDQELIKINKTGGKKKIWQDVFYLEAYEMAREGLLNAQIMHNFGVEACTFNQWLKRKPLLREAIARGRNPKSNHHTLKNYVYANLSPEMKVIWERITGWEDEPNGQRKIEEMLQREGMVIRQWLFLHALVSFGFNKSLACRKVNISIETYNKWVANDPDFAQLIEEMHWHLGNFYENALYNRVLAGDTPATLFANKTVNRKRGYGPTVDVNVNQNVNVNMINLAELNLPFELKQQLLEHIRLQRDKKPKLTQLSAPPGADNGHSNSNGKEYEEIIDVPFRKKHKRSA
jgi:hypothetical protein